MSLKETHSSWFGAAQRGNGLISRRAEGWTEEELEASSSAHKSALGMSSFEENSLCIQRLYKETSAFHISPMKVPSSSFGTTAKGLAETCVICRL